MREPDRYLHAGPAVDLAPMFPDCDVLICDPPYRDHVHDAATSQSKAGGTRRRDLGFASLTPELRTLIASAAGLVRRWSLIYSDVESMADWRREGCNAGAEYIRVIPWIRWSMPQLSGDRPAQGWEAVSVFHAMRSGKSIRKHWNGQGNLLALYHEADEPPGYPDVPALDHKCLRGADKHKAEKPLDQMLDLVSWFSDRGQTVLDLTMGAGTTAVACALLGRGFVGAEIDPAVAAFASARFEAARRGDLCARDLERFARWAERTTGEDVSAFTGPSQERAAVRLADVGHACSVVK